MRRKHYFWNVFLIFKFLGCLHLPPFWIMFSVNTKLRIFVRNFAAFWSLPDFYWWKNNRFIVDHRSCSPIIGRLQIWGPIPLTTANVLQTCDCLIYFVIGNTLHHSFENSRNSCTLSNILYIWVFTLFFKTLQSKFQYQ